MWLCRDTASLRARLGGGGSVATIGAYDGVHLGHQRLLERVVTVAAERELPGVVMSFEPSPKEYFGGTSAPARLMSFREKFVALEAGGIDGFYCPRFDAAMASMTPAEFMEALVVGGLGVRGIVVGDDFRFGRGQSGGVADLVAAGDRHGFEVEQVPSVVVDGRRVSSTAIREALAAGDLDAAERLLGRRYEMIGRVIAGERLGRELGYPTANVDPGRRRCAVSGIFAVRVGGVGERILPGVASVGTRPTVDGTRQLLEVHIFDFDRDVYGRLIRVEFVARLRDELKFPDLESLVEQMHEDAARAREILAA